MSIMYGFLKLAGQPLFDFSQFATVRKHIVDWEINRLSVHLLEEQSRLKAEAEQRWDKKDDGDTGSLKDNNRANKEVYKEDGVEEDPFAKNFTSPKGRPHIGEVKTVAPCAHAVVRYPVDVNIIHDVCKIVDRYI